MDSAPCFTICVLQILWDFIPRMANIIDYLSDGLYEDMDVDTRPPRGIVDIPSSESEVENFGDDDERDSSVLVSSSDSNLGQNVPSVGPSDGHNG